MGMRVGHRCICGPLPSENCHFLYVVMPADPISSQTTAIQRSGKVMSEIRYLTPASAARYRSWLNVLVLLAMRILVTDARAPLTTKGFRRRAYLSHIGNHSRHELRRARSTAPLPLQIVPHVVVHEGQNRSFTDTQKIAAQNIGLTWFSA